MEIKVVIGRKPEPLELEYLHQQFGTDQGVQFCWPETKEEDELLALLPEADVLIHWRWNERMAEAAQQLKLYIIPGAQAKPVVDAFRAGPDLGIKLVNEHGNARFVAEHVVASTLALVRGLFLHDRWMREGKWRWTDEAFASTPLEELTIGLLGYGSINCEVQRMLTPFGCQFNAVRRRELETPGATSFPINKLHDFMRASDVVVVALPATANTVGLIDESALKALGENSWIINVARGEVINQDALYNVLKNKEIKGAMIDVWYRYSPEADEQGRKFPYDHPFYELDNLILSPHRAASPGVHVARWREIVENIKRFRDGCELINIIDVSEGY